MSSGVKRPDSILASREPFLGPKSSMASSPGTAALMSPELRADRAPPMNGTALSIFLPAFLVRPAFRTFLIKSFRRSVSPVFLATSPTCCTMVSAASAFLALMARFNFSFILDPAFSFCCTFLNLSGVSFIFSLGSKVSTFFSDFILGLGSLKMEADLA